MIKIEVDKHRTMTKIEGTGLQIVTELIMAVHDVLNDVAEGDETELKILKLRFCEVLATAELSKEGDKQC